MKRTSYSIVRAVALSFLFSSLSLVLWAQDSTGTVKTTTTTHQTTTTTHTEWYMQPWAWVAGGAVLLIIIIAMFRGNSTTNKETTRTTVIRDRN
jgi:hypothetical protein